MSVRKIKSLKKYAALFLFVFAFGVPCVQFVSLDTVYAAEAQPRADEIRWKYSVINGKLHKRLYNYSTRTWIGNWIPA